MPRSLYAPYRILGLVCDSPVATCCPVLHRQGTATFLTTPVDFGRAVHLYDVDLHIKLVSKPFPSTWPSVPMAALAAVHDLTFVALGRSIAVLKRLTPVALWTKHDANLTHLHIVGDVLVSVCAERLLAWRLPSSAKRAVSDAGELISDMSIPPGFVVTAVAHPPTYINKVLLGALDGRCLLINLLTRRIIYEFSTFGSNITALTPSPVVDVVAIGLENGRVVLHNIRVDETVVDFRHAESSPVHIAPTPWKGAAVVAVSFRSDADESMVTADSAGNMFVWDLNERRLRAEARGVHLGGVALAEYLVGEPVLVTAGMADNAVKVHVFDGVGGEARVLRAREGHCLPPRLVRFCGYDGSVLVSAGVDKGLRLVSAVREARNQSFSQAGVDKRGVRSKKRRRAEAGVEKGDERLDIAKRLPAVVGLASCELRERDEDFANMVTVHEGMREAYTWRLRNAATYGHVLCPPPGPEKYQLAFKRASKQENGKKQKKRQKRKEKEEDRQSTCVVVSPCGNFAIVGGRDGRIHSYNLQSGKHQGVYDDMALSENVKTLAAMKFQAIAPVWAKAHSAAVAGLSVDSCGDLLVSAGSDDSTVKFWNLHARTRDGDSVTAPAGICGLRWCEASDLMAISCTDFCIYVYDAATRKLARKFSGHSGPIVDFCFDPRGRRIVSASIDSTIRTWDLPTGRVVDTRICREAPTSIAVARTGEYIASTHVNGIGISLWVDKSKFGSAPAFALKDIEMDEREDSKRSNGYGDGDEENSNDGDDDTDVQTSDESTESKAADVARNLKVESIAPKPLSLNVATMSAKPWTHWTTLNNLQAIRERNKPKEGAKKPESAPFFLPTVKGLTMQFDVAESSQKDNGEGEKATSKAKRVKKAVHDDDDWANSQLGRLLAREQYNQAAKLLRRLDASGVDMEIRTMEGEKSRRNAALFFREQLESPAEYELTQAHLGVFLSAHGQDIAGDEGGEEMLQGLLGAQQNAWDALRSTFDSVTTLSAYFSGQI